MLTEHERRVQPALQATAAPAHEEELRAAALIRAKRVRRLMINVAAWALGSLLLTTLWVLNEWQANGAFERFGHAGNRGDWNPTLWALAVGGWGLVVGIMALRLYFERPATEAEFDRVRRLRFHVAAWVLGLIVLTPLWALIEWQDNGRFERWSNNGRPGDWEPWILYVGGAWALVIAVLALQAYSDRTAGKAESRLPRLGSRN
jgi:hypothetical protein